MSCCCSQKPTSKEKSIASDNLVQTQNEILSERLDKDRRASLIWLKLAAATVLSGLSMYLSLGVNIANPDGDVRLALHSFLALLTLSAILLLAAPMFVSAWRNLLQKRVTLEHAFLIGIIGAFGASIYSSITHQGGIYYEVVIVLIAIYLFGQTIKSSIVAKHQNLDSQIPGLYGSATVLVDGSSVQKSVRELQVGDTIQIQQGQIVPTDCRIVTGNAYVEQQAHTGETFPQPKSPHDTILAGSTVLDGEITAEAITSGTDRQIDSLLRRLSFTTQSTTKVEVLAQKILNVFVPTVLTIALLTGLIWTLLGYPVEGWLNALTVTVVACPCALGIAIPLAIRRGMISLTKLGMIPKGTDFIDHLAEINHVAFDKTGTLSNSSLELDQLEILPNSHPAIKDWIIQIQKNSTHPVALPFWRLSTEHPTELQDLTIKSIPGRGISADFSEAGQAHNITIGNHLIGETNPSLSSVDAFEASQRKLYVFHNQELAATATLTETIREQSIKAIESLHLNGVKTTILTGDTSIPEELQIPSLTIKSGLTSAQKGDYLTQTEKTHNTLYIGDGLNDCEGFKSASLSLALESGNQLAKQIAHATLLHEDLSVVSEAIMMSKKLKKSLTTTLLFSFSYNAIGITLAALGLIHPIIAAILMFSASIFAISFLTNKTSRV